jgi:hypothetical protein
MRDARIAEEQNDRERLREKMSGELVAVEFGTSQK